ncbi:uncharacterized protein SCDLUD_002864 [Saccharomycodes ludwigii]|uniref:uncharacterized protein n=1 Tax=Saccharomycodes ludwigii TaxID=36035 RepID=UPI001E8B4ABF|nr:hypothetical protein SCDLUD_002864 [Saccharomycodes ludwigii]KAH3901372.1 hypothetical protein SCDLUD_002864 [Saccharomycodes ludwigii]
MKTFFTFIQILIALIFFFSTTVFANSEKFELIAIRSGSPIQYAPITLLNGVFTITSLPSSKIVAYINDKSELVINDDEYAFIKDDGSIALTLVEERASKFTIDDLGYLSYNGKDGLSAIPTGHGFKVSAYSSGNEDSITFGAKAVPCIATPNVVQPTFSTLIKRQEVSQISDGQIQAPATTITTETAQTITTSAPETYNTETITTESVQTVTTSAPETYNTGTITSVITAELVSQISDGQIQATIGIINNSTTYIPSSFVPSEGNAAGLKGNGGLSMIIVLISLAFA